MKVRIALAALAGVATLATVGMAATATGASAGTIPATVSHVNFAPRNCAGWQLSATLTSGYQARWGNRELVLTLTNTSSMACSLSGYPSLQLLNSRHQPLPTAVVQVPGRTSWPAQAVLHPGQSAIADITFAVYGRVHPLGNYPGPGFYQGSAAYLAVTLPGSSGIYQPYGSAFMPRLVLPIPGGPLTIAQNRLYETPLMLEFPGVW